MYVTLAGGVGGGRLAYGLSRVLDPAELLVAVNTGDDFNHLGLDISPDLDTVCYALAELDHVDRGWGRAGETWHFLETLRALDGPDWFSVGDADVALHVARTIRRAVGQTLSEVTDHLARKMDVPCRVVPMSNDRVATIINTDAGPLPFQEYFVRQQCRPVARGFEYRGAAEASAHPDLLAALTNVNLEAVIIAPSNPWLSIAPILAVPAIGSALESCAAPRVAVSPIVGGAALKGPAAKLMADRGIEVSALSIARHYAGRVDALVIDSVDAQLRGPIEKLGLEVFVTDTIMHGRAERIRLAREIAQWIHS